MPHGHALVVNFQDVAAAAAHVAARNYIKKCAYFGMKITAFALWRVAIGLTT